MNQNEILAYVITWRNELRKPELFLSLYDAQGFAAKEGVPVHTWARHSADTWQAGDWFIDVCPLRDMDGVILALRAYAYPGSWRDQRRWGGPESGPMVAKRALAGLYGYGVEADSDD